VAKKIRKMKKTHFLALEFPTMEAMQFGLNHYLNAGWLLLDMRSEHNDFWQNHTAWVVKKSLVFKMNKILNNDALEKSKLKKEKGFEKI